MSFAALQNMSLQGFKLCTIYIGDERFRYYTVDTNTNWNFQDLRKYFNQHKLKNETMDIYTKIGNVTILIECEKSLQFAIEKANQQQIQWLHIYHQQYIVTMCTGEHYVKVLNDFESTQWSMEDLKRTDTDIIIAQNEFLDMVKITCEQDWNGMCKYMFHFFICMFLF